MTPEEKVRQFLPLAAAWIEQQEQQILQHGVALSEAERHAAQQIGVQHPERVRILTVDAIPTPSHPALHAAAREAGLVSPYTAGMAMRYGIYLRADAPDHASILVHELTHTAQYERLGGIAAFLEQYLTECLTVGYLHSPWNAKPFRPQRSLFRISAAEAKRCRLDQKALSAVTSVR